MSEEKTPETIAKAEYEALRSKHTEVTGKLTDFEKQFERVNRLGGLDKIAADLEAFNLLQQEKAAEKPEDLKKWKETTEQTIRQSIQKDVDTWKTKAEQAESKYKERVIIDTAFTVAAGKLHDSAKDDFKSLTRQHGDLDEKGNVIFKDSEGKILYKEGSTTEPLDAQGFVSWAIKNKPHYFVSQTLEGDRDTNATSTASSAGITVDQYLNMSAQEHAKLPLATRAELARKARQANRV